jgi:hypothetical protein
MISDHLGFIYECLDTDWLKEDTPEVKKLKTRARGLLTRLGHVLDEIEEVPR